MSFQWIFDNAESFAIDRLSVVAQTQSRSGVVRAVQRGTPAKKFTVRLPDGPPWDEYKDLIESAEALDRHTPDTIEIKYDRFPWYYKDIQPSSNDSFEIICVAFPSWEIFKRNQIRWSGAFEFVEVV